MPIYEYRCGPCGHRFEVLCSRHDEAVPACPQCGGSQVVRILSVFAVTRGGSQPTPGPCGSADCACRRV